MEREIERFKAADETGTVTLVVYQEESASARTRAEPHRVVPTLKRVETDDGLSCRRIDDDTYEIRETGRVVTRVR